MKRAKALDSSGKLVISSISRSLQGAAFRSSEARKFRHFRNHENNQFFQEGSCNFQTIVNRLLLHYVGVWGEAPEAKRAIHERMNKNQ